MSRRSYTSNEEYSTAIGIIMDEMRLLIRTRAHAIYNAHILFGIEKH